MTDVSRRPTPGRTAVGLVGALCVLTAIAGTARPGSAQDGSLSIESLLEIEHPSLAAWSPDGRRVAYVSDRAGVQNVHVVDVASRSSRRLTAFDSASVGGRWLEDGPIDGLFWGDDGALLYFDRAGTLMRVPASGDGPARPAWEGAEAAGGYVPSPGGSRVAYVRDGDLRVRALAAGSRERRLTDGDERIREFSWSPDEERIAFAATPAPESTLETPDYNGGKLHFSRTSRPASHVGVLALSDGSVRVPAGGDGSESRPRWAGTDRIVFQRVTPDLTVREIVRADLTTGETAVLHRDSGGEWWSLTYIDAGPFPSPDGERIAFVSDRDGWDHLYLMSVDGGDPLRVTGGEFEVRNPRWSGDGGRIAFDTNEGGNPGSRRIRVAAVPRDRGDVEVRSATPVEGVDTGPIWSPDDGMLLFQRTSRQHPAELYVTDPRRREIVRLTRSMPTALRDTRFAEPEYVTYEAPDGGRVPAYLFVPEGADRSDPVPAIVWIHGDGVNQNYDGWHVERNYAVFYSVHQYLIDQGYAVLAVDYRGSIGYGRDWREGHYRDLGGADHRDVAAGIDYLAGLGFVDTERVGVWGLSYGGFLTLQAVTLDPGLFACGIDVAGVVDWRDWYRDPGGSWIRGRMGSPDENPDLYDRTAPIHRVDRITGPLAVLHGTADVNVPFLESVRLVDRLQKETVPVDFEMYPGEYHYFHRAHVLRAAWKRVDDFFGGCLGGN